MKKLKDKSDKRALTADKSQVPYENILYRKVSYCNTFQTDFLILIIRYSFSGNKRHDHQKSK